MVSRSRYVVYAILADRTAIVTVVVPRQGDTDRHLKPKLRISRVSGWCRTLPTAALRFSTVLCLYVRIVPNVNSLLLKFSNMQAAP